MSTQPKVTMMAIELLKPYWRNARHSEASVDYLVKVIGRYGFQVPIVVDAQHVIIAGHSRYRAALILGILAVPVIITDLSPDRARQFRIVDNKVSELAKWDVEKLGEELKDLSDLENVQKLFGDSQWASIVTATFETPPALEEPPPVSSLDPSSPSNDEFEVICPHCGKTNHFKSSQVA